MYNQSYQCSDKNDKKDLNSKKPKKMFHFLHTLHNGASIYFQTYLSLIFTWQVQQVLFSQF